MGLLSNKKKKQYDYGFIKNIQPQANIAFSERVIRKGDGYETCLHLYELPQTVMTFWLDTLTNIQGSVVTIDVTMFDSEELKKQIDRSLIEDKQNYYGAKKDTDQSDAGNSFQKLIDIYNSISNDGEVLKMVHIRIFIAAKTLAELEDQSNSIGRELEAMGYRCGVFLNEQEYEYRSMLISYTDQQQYINRRDGNPVPTEALAGGYPYTYTQLSDPYGAYLGYINGGGSVIFDLFQNDNALGKHIKYRLCYDAIIAGKKGAGKSTLCKLIVKTRAVLGDVIRGIAVSGEFDALVEKLGGKMISIDGSEGILNFMEIIKYSENPEICFTSHISKLGAFYRYLKPKVSVEEISEFESICRKLYINWGLWNEKEKDRKIYGLDPKDYPIFSDLLALIQNELYSDIDKNVVNKNITRDRIRRLENIETQIKNITQSYGYLFNGYTSFPDISDEQIVFFDIRNLTKIKREIFSVQMFNILNMFWSTMMTTGLNSKKEWDSLSDKSEVYKIKKVLMVIDEAHHLINTNNADIIDYLLSFMRETRKYFTSLLFATQSFRDMVSDSAGTEVINKLKTLFEMTQYKFIMQQDSNAIPFVKSIFNDQFTGSETAAIPYFSQGECLLNDGVKTLRVMVDITDEEKALFSGGA